MGSLEEAFKTTVASCKALEPGVDAALIETGRKVAIQVDSALENGNETEKTKALYLVPHLMNVLRDMGATPKARKDMELGKESDAGGKLAKLRAVKSA